MEVHEARPRRHIEPHLDIREDELNVGKTPGNMLPKHLFVRVGDVIVCDTNCFNLGRDAFQRGQVIRPSVAASELVIENGSGSVDVRLPAPPLRSSIYHPPPLRVSLMRPIDIRSALSANSQAWSASSKGPQAHTMEKLRGQQCISCADS